MQKKLIASFFIALLVGLGGGYVLGYVAYQPQIQNFQSDLETIKNELRTPSWKVIRIVENLNLIWSTQQKDDWVVSETIDVGSISIGNYSRMRLYIEVKNFTPVGAGGNAAKVVYTLESLYDYGKSEFYRRELYWDSYGPQSFFDVYPSGGMRETSEPSIRITIQGQSRTPNYPLAGAISCLVSMGIFLRN